MSWRTREALVGLVLVCAIATVLPAQQTVPNAGAEGADAHEELQQLIAQAEALAGPDSPATADAVAAISEELEALKAGLEWKASLLEHDQNTDEAELEIAARRETLQAVMAAATDPEPGAEAPPVIEETSEDTGSMVARIDAYVGEALSLLGRIRELLAMDRDERAEISEGMPENAPASDEALQDVTGVVTEAGVPVEGVSVSDSDSGVTAVTDSEGQYTLEGVPAGRPAKLVLSKGDAQVGEGQLDLTPGHDGIGDFELKPLRARTRPPLTVLPAVVVVPGAKAKAAGNGSLRGTLRDADGRAIARALVRLGDVGRARTSSKGQYAFLNVPPGTYELKVFKPGFPMATERVRVAGTTTDASISLRPRASKAKGAAGSLVRKGSGTHMKGTIASVAGPPIRAAKVTLMRAGRAVSVRSGPQGAFLFRDVEPGRYRVLVTKAGFHSAAGTVSLESGASRVRTYRLKRTARPASITTRTTRDATASPSRTPPTANPPGARGPSAVPGRRGGGVLAGRVLDAGTRQPIAGAVVTMGTTSVTTDSRGLFRVGTTGRGAQRVVIRADGYRQASRTVTLDTRDRTTATFTLIRAAASDRRR